jgi:hypothetical protein
MSQVTNEGKTLALDMPIGHEEVRQQLHQEHGGRKYGGISPSRVSDVVMLFTDPKKGMRHGYVDGWGEDGHYHYCGEGQFGDQRMTNGNKAILQHQDDGRGLHLFETVKPGVVAYRGEFELARDTPWYRTEAPDNNRDMRSVIMFRLRPRFASDRRVPQIPRTPKSAPRVRDTAVSRHLTKETIAKPPKDPSLVTRRESALVTEYVEHLEKLGHHVINKEITPPGERNALYTDAFDDTENRLIEAKGSTTREAIRMAIGQLFDYQRFIDPPPSLAILTPTKPRSDLRDLCAALAIQNIWRGEHGFEATAIHTSHSV